MVVSLLMVVNGLRMIKVFQLKVNGVAFRLIPESTQVKNALKERKTAGIDDDDFHGVPVFQFQILFFRAASIIHGNCKIEVAANEESDGAGVSKKRP
ncbi:Tic22-like [Arabidopsis suecica]|uniref:Tic22-like n=1 Tax=Arabidopsis suecica TaxID=45249 RepID=A0A8T1YLK0_ARASU|nr:Tic22-like [Arabidopsis suecica]